VKEFAVYTALRVLMFAATFGIVIGIWVLATGTANILVALVVGFVVSGIGSYFLLNRQREALARRVEQRAEKATAAFEQLRAKEDAEQAEQAERAEEQQR
jgi:uncharacterized membrane protein YfcA